MTTGDVAPSLTVGFLKYRLASLNKRRPIRTRCVSPAMLSPRNVAVNQCGFDWWKLVGAEIFFAEQLVHRPGRRRRHEHPFLINPLAFDFRRSGADEDGPRGAECDQFMSVNRQIIRR